MCGQVLRGIEQPQKSLPADAWGRFTRAIPWRNLFIPGALVVGPDTLLDRRVPDHEEPPMLHVATTRGADARLQDLSDQFVRNKDRLQRFSRRIERVARMIPNRGVVFSAASGIARSVMRPLR